METRTWNIDKAHSGVHFSVRHMVIAKVRGDFTDFNGQLQLDPADLTHANVVVEIEAKSIDTHVADRDNHLRSGDFLDVEQYPLIRFKSTQVAKGQGERYRVTGELTIRDVTREVVLDTEFGGQGQDPWGNQRVAFTATASVDRRDFGLTWNQALETGGVLVGERIDIQLDVQAVQAASSQVA